MFPLKLRCTWTYILYSYLFIYLEWNRVLFTDYVFSSCRIFITLAFVMCVCVNIERRLQARSTRSCDWIHSPTYETVRLPRRRRLNNAPTPLLGNRNWLLTRLSKSQLRQRIHSPSGKTELRIFPFCPSLPEGFSAYLLVLHSQKEISRLSVVLWRTCVLVSLPTKLSP